MESKRNQTHKNRVGRWLTGAKGQGTWGDVGQRAQISRYKTDTFWGPKVQHDDDH